ITRYFNCVLSINSSANRELSCSGTLSRRSLAMGILAWIVLGLVAGALAKFIMPGQQGGGIILTIVLGVGDISGFDLRSIAIAVGGALLVLLVYGLVARGRA